MQLFKRPILAILFLQFSFGVTLFFAAQNWEFRILALSFIALVPVIGYLLRRSYGDVSTDEHRLRELSRNLSDKNWELARSNEQLRIANEHKSEFMSITSHQLRTPLTALTGYLSMILEHAYGPVPIELNTPITRAHQSAVRLSNLVNELLRITRIEQNDLVFDLTPVDIVSMLHDLTVEFQSKAVEHGLHMVLEIEPRALPYTAQADESKLREVLHNIIDNALTYTPEGSVTITLKQADDGMIRILVRDTGIGIAHEDIRMLFAKFHRGENGIKQFADGSGLGLYIAKKLIIGMHGEITIESEGPGKGATFIIELPQEGAPVAIKPSTPVLLPLKPEPLVAQ